MAERDIERRKEGKRKREKLKIENKKREKTKGGGKDTSLKAVNNYNGQINLLLLIGTKSGCLNKMYTGVYTYFMTNVWHKNKGNCAITRKLSIYFTRKHLQFLLFDFILPNNSYPQFH